MPKPRRLLVLTALALSSILLIVQPASATPPSFDTFHAEEEFLFADCGAFQLTETFTVDVRITTFFNEQGDAITATLHITLPRRKPDTGLAVARLRRSGAVRISSYFRTL
jgi:hypothetical protein